MLTPPDLRKVFRKTGITSRPELVRLVLAEHDACRFAKLPDGSKVEDFGSDSPINLHLTTGPVARVPGRRGPRGDRRVAARGIGLCLVGMQVEATQELGVEGDHDG
jgi:hypothetical protein